MITVNDIAPLAALIQTEQRERLIAQGYKPEIHNHAVTVTMAKKFARVDVGNSGKYMVDLADGTIYGIKGYGVVHRGHVFGTLATINQWFWGDYRAMRKAPKPPYQPKTGQPCTCKPGQQRDNCPACEGTGWCIDFRAIRARNEVTK